MARDFKSFLKGKGKNVDPEIEEKIPQIGRAHV